MFEQHRKLWWGMLALLVLTPLGLIAQGTAFGEWGTDQLLEEVGRVPSGLAAWADTWRYAIMADYAVPGLNGSVGSVLGYIASGFIGVALVIGLVVLFSRTMKE